jgi:spore coat protein U-like protein
MSRPIALALTTLVVATAPCSAQLVVQGIRNLDFGAVLQGVAESVPPTDPVNSGQFYFRTPALGTRIRIQFTLPTQLNVPSGAQLPISFANNDAMARGTAPTSNPVLFNPKVTNSFTMTTSVDANVWLGGTVSPGAAQAVGTYTNTVIMTVTIF